MSQIAGSTTSGSTLTAFFDSRDDAQDAVDRLIGAGIPATVARVIDRPAGRRILALTATGEAVELDVAPETQVSAREQGIITIERARVYAAG